MVDRLHQRTPARTPAADVSLAATRLASPGWSDEERRALDAVAAPVRAVEANTALAQEGAARDRFHVLVEGWACRYKVMRNGSRQIVALLLAGDVVNLDTLLLGRAEHGVRTLSAARVISLPCDRVLALAERYPGIARTLTQLALAENALLGQQVVRLGRQSARQRLAHLFCELAVRVAGGPRASVRFELPLTQEQLADALGLTPVHVNRMMQQLRQSGLVATAGRIVTLPDMAQLAAEAEFSDRYLQH